MSDSDFSVNADAMGPAVEGLKSLGDRLGQITQHLESTLDGLGKPWGDDKNGHNFFQQYGKSRDQVLTGMSSMTDAVHGVATGIHTMIKGYNNINDHAKETARKLGTYSGDGSGDYTGGGSGGYGNGDYTTDQPLQPTRRMMARRLTDAVPAREDALMPAEEGVPAEPLQRRVLREGTVLPDAGEPLQPLLPREAELDRPMKRLLPEESIPARFEAAEPAIPGEPALPVETARHEAMPLLPESRLMPVEPTIPAEPARLTAVHDGAPLLPAEGRVTYPRHAEMPLLPAEGQVTYPTHREMPLLPAEGRVTYPTHQVMPLEPARAFERVHDAIPDEPVRLERVQEGTPTLPAEPVRSFERVHEGTSVEQPREFVRSEAPLEPRLYERAVPAEPAGFAELEPERYSPLLPETPAVPEQ